MHEVYITSYNVKTDEIIHKTEKRIVNKIMYDVVRRFKEELLVACGRGCTVVN